MKKVILALFAFVIVLFLTSCENDRKKKNDTNSPPDEVEITPSKPTVNVYVENSVSMFGYISSGNEFDRSISSLLTSIKVSGYTDSINLFYINSRTFRQNVDISTFIRRTNIHNAQTWPGDKSKTDMCALFDTVASAVNDSTISIFVSDCIFSPGKNEDAGNYIGAQKDKITTTINKKLNSQNLAFIVYRLKSEFKGDYFDCKDDPTPINDKRPYFIWIIGTAKNIGTFKQKIPTSKIEGNLQNSFTISKNKGEITYAIQLHPKIGDFKRTDSKTIINAKKDNDSEKFMFSIAVDFSSLLVDPSYLIDSGNYDPGNTKYSLEIIAKPMEKYTHLIKVTTTSRIISPTKLTIKLKNKIPDWIYTYSDSTCTNIKNNGMMERTYGLSHIVKGIYKAFNYQQETLSKIEISINQ